MYVAVKKSTQIVGMDFSYSTERERMVSIYCFGYNSVIVDTHFVDLVTMLNGMFTSGQIRDYMTGVLGYSLEKSKRIEEDVLAWGITDMMKNPSNWGNSINIQCGEVPFKRYRISIRKFKPRYIDLLIMLAKYGMSTYKIDNDFVIDETMFNESLIINYDDIGKKVSEIMTERYGVNVVVGTAISESANVEDIVVCERGDCDDEGEYTIIETDDYCSEMNICEHSLFSSTALKDELCRKISVNLNILSDIIFGVTNGFYS